MKKRTDKERMDWLHKHSRSGIALINDDNGHWVVVADGAQNLPRGKAPCDINTTHFIEKRQWRKTVRGAIDLAMKEL